MLLLSPMHGPDIWPMFRTYISRSFNVLPQGYLIWPLYACAGMRALASFIVALSSVTAMLADPTCTPETRIEGVQLAVQTIVTGDDSVGAEIPIAPYATIFAHVDDTSIAVGVGHSSCRTALRLLHSIFTSGEFTYCDGGGRKASGNGTLQIASPSMVEGLKMNNVSTRLDIVYDNKICQAGKIDVYFRPSQGSSKLVELLQGALTQKD